MRRNVGLLLAWLGATVLSVFIASTAVAGIRDRVVEAPVALGAPTTSTTLAQATTATTTTTTLATTTTVTTTTEPPEVTVAAEATTTTTTTAPPQTTTTTTTSTTTTTTAPAFDYPTFSLVGGTVTLEVGGGEVHVVSATPNTGFHGEVEANGPTQVKVEFEGNEHKSVFTATFEDGELKPVIREEDEDDHGDD